MQKTIQVVHKGKGLTFPYRIYDPVPFDWMIGLMGASKKKEVFARFTRHHDGHVRQKFIQKLIDLDPSLAIPYAIQLTSEYVVELIITVHNNLGKFNQRELCEFVTTNKSYLLRSNDRMISYWDCYYRSTYPRLSEYIGTIFF